MKKEELRHDPVRENIVKGVQYFSENTATVLQILAAIVIAIGGSPGGRAHARTGDRYQDMKEMGIKNPK